MTRRLWWRRKRWIAAAILVMLPPAYLGSLAPVGYGVGRGWVSTPATNVYVAPLEAMVGLPGESLVGGLLRSYARWWVDLGRRHAAP